MGKLILNTIRAIRNKLHIVAGVRKNVRFDRSLILGPGSYLNAPTRLEIGRDVSIGAYCFIACNGRIGDGVLISSHVGIFGREDHDMHHIGKPISKARWLYDAPPLLSDPTHRVDIGVDVWIGFGARILSGITVGRGAVIGAGALVTKDVAPYMIVAGAPAKQIGSRFSLEMLQEHEILLRKEYGY